MNFDDFDNLDWKMHTNFLGNFDSEQVLLTRALPTLRPKILLLFSFRLANMAPVTHI